MKEFPDYYNKWNQTYFDSETFEKLCSILCTVEEIAFFMNMSVTKLMKRCSTFYGLPFDFIYLQKTSKGVISLRRKKFQLSEKGNLKVLNSILKTLQNKYLKYLYKNISEIPFNANDFLFTTIQNEYSTPSEQIQAYDRFLNTPENKQEDRPIIIDSHIPDVEYIYIDKENNKE